MIMSLQENHHQSERSQDDVYIQSGLELQMSQATFASGFLSIVNRRLDPRVRYLAHTGGISGGTRTSNRCAVAETLKDNSCPSVNSRSATSNSSRYSDVCIRTDERQNNASSPSNSYIQVDSDSSISTYSDDDTRDWSPFHANNSVTASISAVTSVGSLISDCLENNRESPYDRRLHVNSGSPSSCGTTISDGPHSTVCYHVESSTTVSNDSTIKIDFTRRDYPTANNGDLNFCHVDTGCDKISDWLSKSSFASYRNLPLSVGSSIASSYQESIYNTDASSSRVNSCSTESICNTDASNSRADSCSTEGIYNTDASNSRADSCSTESIYNADASNSRADSCSTESIYNADASNSRADSCSTEGIYNTDASNSRADSCSTESIYNADASNSRADSCSTEGIYNTDASNSRADSCSTEGIYNADASNSRADSCSTEGIYNTDGSNSRADSCSTESICNTDASKYRVKSCSTESICNTDASNSRADSCSTESICNTDASNYPAYCCTTESIYNTEASNSPADNCSAVNIYVNTDYSNFRVNSSPETIYNTSSPIRGLHGDSCSIQTVIHSKGSSNRPLIQVPVPYKPVIVCDITDEASWSVMMERKPLKRKLADAGLDGVCPVIRKKHRRKRGGIKRRTNFTQTEFEHPHILPSPQMSVFLNGYKNLHDGHQNQVLVDVDACDGNMAAVYCQVDMETEYTTENLFSVSFNHTHIDVTMGMEAIDVEACDAEISAILCN